MIHTSIEQLFCPLKKKKGLASYPQAAGSEWPSLYEYVGPPGAPPGPTHSDKKKKKGLASYPQAAGSQWPSLSEYVGPPGAPLGPTHSDKKKKRPGKLPSSGR